MFPVGGVGVMLLLIALAGLVAAGVAVVLSRWYGWPWAVLCGLLLFRAGDPTKHADKVFLLGAVDARFLKPVIPGDQLLFDVVAEKVISTAAIVRGVGLVDGEPVVRAKLTFAAVDRRGLGTPQEDRPA